MLSYPAKVIPKVFVAFQRDHMIILTLQKTALLSSKLYSCCPYLAGIGSLKVGVPIGELARGNTCDSTKGTTFRHLTGITIYDVLIHSQVAVLVRLCELHFCPRNEPPLASWLHFVSVSTLATIGHTSTIFLIDFFLYTVEYAISMRSCLCSMSFWKVHLGIGKAHAHHCPLDHWSACNGKFWCILKSYLYIVKILLHIHASRTQIISEAWLASPVAKRGHSTQLHKFAELRWKLTLSYSFKIASANS